MNLWPLPPSTLVGRGSPNILSPGLGKHGEKTQHILCLSVHVSNLQLISQQAPSTHIRILITLTSLSLSLSLGGSRTQKLREWFQPGPVAMDGKESITKQPTNCNYLSWRILIVQTRENINADKHNCKNKDLAYLEHIEPLQVYILSSILVGVSCLQSRKRRLSVLWTQFLTPCLTAKASAELYHYVVMNDSSFGCHF